MFDNYLHIKITVLEKVLSIAIIQIVARVVYSPSEVLWTDCSAIQRMVDPLFACGGKRVASVPYPFLPSFAKRSRSKGLLRR
jgi:hypothetical protein